MAEINLLPGELRGKEEKEMAAVHKIPRVVKIEMSKPRKEEKPSFFRRLFGGRKKAEKSKETPKPEYKPMEKKEEKPNLPPNRPQLPPILPKPMIGYNNKNNGNKAPNFKANGPSAPRPWDLPPAQPAPAAPKLEDALKSLLEEKKPVLPALKPPAIEKKVEPAPVKPIKKEKSAPARGWSVSGRRGGSPPEADAPLVHAFGGEKKAEKDRPAVIGVNLLAQAFGGGQDLSDLGKKFTIFIAVGLGLVILIAGIYFGIIFYQKTVEGDIARLKSRIVSLDQEIAGQESEKTEALDLQRRLKLIQDLLDQHIYWTKFFGLLEKYTVDEVYYLNFSMAGREKLVISAVGRDYKSLAKQLIAFEQAKDFIKSVRIDSAAAEIDAQKAVYKGVKFNINLEFAPDIFLKPAE